MVIRDLDLLNGSVVQPLRNSPTRSLSLPSSATMPAAQQVSPQQKHEQLVEHRSLQHHSLRFRFSSSFLFLLVVVSGAAFAWFLNGAARSEAPVLLGCFASNRSPAFKQQLSLFDPVGQCLNAIRAERYAVALIMDEKWCTSYSGAENDFFLESLHPCSPTGKSSSNGVARVYVRSSFVPRLMEVISQQIHSRETESRECTVNMPREPCQQNRRQKSDRREQAAPASASVFTKSLTAAIDFKGASVWDGPVKFNSNLTRREMTLEVQGALSADGGVVVGPRATVTFPVGFKGCQAATFEVWAKGLRAGDVFREVGRSLKTRRALVIPDSAEDMSWKHFTTVYMKDGRVVSYIGDADQTRPDSSEVDPASNDAFLSSYWITRKVKSWRKSTILLGGGEGRAVIGQARAYCRALSSQQVEDNFLASRHEFQR
eukprot:NODE_1225_length_1628_cov_38.345155_g1090_i0.p1 GENE.NODE_1225_length_1628_cov_38.345155_g1090_i0~~NODE_1225_length_1628_cov_38.345155_g1090_i0.p1  ORF type:complete len:430 (+),score=38.01 NODE_1225_length_1628_cov_38.345155_g1090_i0:82-1371(+)